MRLRPYLATDLSAITDIGAICNKQDALSQYMTCNADKYPTSYRLSNLRWLRDKIAASGSVAWVVVTEEGDRPSSLETANPEQVIGWAIWSRVGQSETARTWQRPNETLGKRLEQALFKLESKYYQYMPNLNPTREKQHNENIDPILREEWNHEILPEMWELEGCYVDPEWQKKGVGSMMVKWGLQQAQQEGVPVMVKASPAGLGMYEKNGFRRIKKMGFDAWFELGGEGCWALMWEPEGAAERWWERVVENEKEKGKD